MSKNSSRWVTNSLLCLFLLLLLAPLLALFSSRPSADPIVRDLFELARINTVILAIGVLFLTSLLGGVFAYLHSFYRYPGQKILHAFMLMPLAFPAYVLAFIYLGALGPSTHWSNYLEVQGELWFLIVILSMALMPYVYYFSCLGFRTISQSEVETEILLAAGKWKFFTANVGPKWLPFLISSQILVLFEALSDFGAASVVNVPVITTMIYKLWFDLFSFAGAVHLSLKYSLLILVFLVIELVFKGFQDRGMSTHRDPLQGQPLGVLARAVVLTMMLVFVFLAFVWPTLQIALWAIQGSQLSLWLDTFKGALNTIVVGAIVGVLVVLLACSIQIPLRLKSLNPKLWTVFSTIGYSIPGSILAVSIYGLLLTTTDSITSEFLLMGLVVGLVYKFLTVAMRPIGETVYCLPQDLIDISRVLNVSWGRKIRDFFYPSLKESCIVALLMVIIEVMKEMPLTLMLAPSEFQTLSIKIFNFTSEGEWEKAALPSLLLIMVGIISVSLINLRRTQT